MSEEAMAEVFMLLECYVVYLDQSRCQGSTTGNDGKRTT